MILQKIIKPREAFIKKFGLLKGYIISKKLFPKDKQAKTVMLKVPSYTNKITLRANTSDVSTFTKVIMDEEYFFKINFKPKFIIDAGANIGLASLYFLKLFPKLKVVAIEPEKNNFDLLMQNTMGLNIECLLGAVWCNKTFIKIKDTNANTSGFEIIETNHSSENTVQAFTIGDIFLKQKLEFIDVLKMDIEGAEKEVFSTNYETWLPYTKILIIETHDRFKQGCTESLMNALSKYDFSKLEKGENLFFINNKFNVSIEL